MLSGKLFFKTILLLTFSYSLFSCKPSAKPKVLYNMGNKSISRILSDIKQENVHLDRKVCRSLIETISKRSATEVLSLRIDEKNEILRIAITATIDLQSFFAVVNKKVSEGLTTIKKDSALKKELFNVVDLSIDLAVIKVILSDGEYLKKAELDSVLFAMSLMLAHSMHLEGYEKMEHALKEGDSQTMVDILSKVSIEVVLYSYSIIRGREELQTVNFAGVKLIDLLPEMKVKF